MRRNLNRTGAITLVLVALAGAAVRSDARAAADPWVGTYAYTYEVPTLSGVVVTITYTLIVRAGTGTGSATIKGEGHQTNDEVICDTRAEGDRLVVSFRSYPDGGTANQFGVELYKPGAVLVTLERRGELITHWGRYNTDAPKPKGGAVQFKPVR